MKTPSLLRTTAIPLLLLCSLAAQVPLFAEVTAFTYQGRLNTDTGPANGLYDFTFSIYDQPTGTGLFAIQTNLATQVSNGLFTVSLDLGPVATEAIFSGPPRWLEIASRTNASTAYATLTPRQQLTATPYAVTAANLVSGGLAAGTYGNAYTFNNPANTFFGNGGGLTNVNAATLGGLGPNAFWQTTGNVGTIPGPNFLGTTDNQPLEFQVNGTRALRIEPHGTDASSLVGGYLQNSVAGSSGSVLAGGGASALANSISGNYTFIGTGIGNTNLANYSFIGSGANNLIGAGSDYSLISGGQYNFIQSTARYATVAGGYDNRILTNSDTATIGGGHDNTIQSAPYSVISGGGLNQILPGAYDAVIGGGGYNQIQTNSVGAAIGGGDFNTVDTNSPYGTIGGGYGNTIQPNSPRATIGGGVNNQIQTNADIATIAGGHDNTIQSAPFSVIGGGGLNLILPGAYDAVISGGGYNQIRTNSVAAAIGGGDFNTVDTNSPYGTIGGGYQNMIQANSSYSAIAGGGANMIQTNSEGSTIGGGVQNTIEINATFSTIAGGAGNTIETNSFSATIGGGYVNTIRTNASYSTIAGGGFNTIQTNAYGSTVGGGGNNTIQTNAPYSTIGGGYNNIIQTNASFAVVPGGSNNLAAGNYSFAAGQQAQALHMGSFVWADSQNAPFASTANDQFNVRAQGGVRFVTLGAGLSVDGEPAALLNGGQTFTGTNVFNNPANSFTGNGGGLTNVNAATLGGLGPSAFWQTTGNAGTLPGPNFIGTTDNQPLELQVNGARALRLEPHGTNAPSLAGGYSQNSVAGVSGSVVAGGGSNALANSISGNYTFIGTGLGNTNSANYSFIGSGTMNYIGSFFAYAFIGGGYSNTVFGQYATVAGGYGNSAGANAAVGGGAFNQAAGNYSTVAGGIFNSATNYEPTVGGGENNSASGGWSTVSGGLSNSAENNYASIGGGVLNTNRGYAGTVSGGWFNLATNDYATVPGGFYKVAGGTYSFAAGQQAQALHQGSFVWADSQNASFASTASNQFLIRASGGVGINKANPASTLDVNGTARIQGANGWDVNNTEGDFRVGNDTYRFKIGVAIAGGGAGDVWMRAQGGTGRVFLKTPGGITIFSNEGQTNGVSLAAGGGAWSSVSDRNSKENFTTVDPQQILQSVVSLPLTTWNYKSQEKSIRHIGPMAQDFAAAFHVGEDDRHITTIDADGVALAAIQGLNQKLEEKDAEIRKLKQQNDSLDRRMSELEELITQAVHRK